MSAGKVRVAFIDEPANGLGWHGRGVQVEPGAYRVAELDAMEDGIIMLCKPDEKTFLAMVKETSVKKFIEVLDGPHSVERAIYYRKNPDALAARGEQSWQRP